MPKPKIVIIGGGPAGLTAAYELSKENKYNITVLEKQDVIGGISKTVDYKGNLIDIGGHRFFSKSPRVLKWWSNFLPIVDANSSQEISYHNQSINLNSIFEKNAQNAMLIRPRKSRIYFGKRFFDYPLKINYALIKNLGKKRSLRIARDIFKAHLFPIKPEVSLEDFYINRFGRTLYETFFKDYTRKVWGKECTDISNEWGKQRIKTLGVFQILWHSFLKLLPQVLTFNKKTETSLIEKFLYPSKGPGMLWDKVRDECRENGVEFIFNAQANKIFTTKNAVSKIQYRKNNTVEELKCKAVFSTMPIRHLINAIEPKAPDEVLAIADGLEYRDFIIVGLLLSELKFEPENGEFVKDNWLYIQDKGVNVGRMQIFNNWSPYMVSSDDIWIGAEYFCDKSDAIWKMTEEELIALALKELDQIGVLNPKFYLDGKVVKCAKAYPSYTGTYEKLNVVQEHINTIDNLFPMGRNGLHKYNNQDHSMLTAFKAVEIFEGENGSKEELWAINSDDEYHESGKQ